MEFLFQITECGRRGNQVTSVVVADGVENVAIKDVSMFPDHGLSFRAGRLKLCMQPLHTRALVNSHINLAFVASEAVDRGCLILLF